jgi:hypothetical protein
VRTARWAVLVTGLGLLAGCASAGAHATAAPPATAASAPLATSMASMTGSSSAASGGAAWAILAMGGAAAAENQFWELFTRQAGSDQWRLVTPPGVADNGGLVATGAGASVTVAFRPSQDLTFSPLAATTDGGKAWTAGLLDAPVASVPDALAGDGPSTMLALLSDGAVEQASASGGGWTRLAAPGAIASSAAGRRCQVGGLTAVAYTPSGTPLVAAECGRAGVAGLFAHVGGSWQTAGPTVSSVQSAQVLRLSGDRSGDTALLQVGGQVGGRGGGLIGGLVAAWTGPSLTGESTGWATSAPLAGAGRVLGSGTGADGAVWVLLTGNRAAVISGPGGTWRMLTAPPPGTAVLAALPGGVFQALAVSGAKLTVYRLTTAGGWSSTQVINVPIQYGSSS